METNTEQLIFEAVDKIGEILDGDLHIIDNTEAHPVEGEKSYRVYQKEGFCFDIKKVVEQENEKTGEIEKYDYQFYCEWDGGFFALNKERALELVTKHK